MGLGCICIGLMWFAACGLELIRLLVPLRFVRFKAFGL